MDPARRSQVERDVLRALERFHREAPMVPTLRLDALMGRIVQAQRPASSRHRGGRAVELGWDELLEAIDALADRGLLVRDGRRVALVGGGAGLGPEMRERADALIDTLLQGGATPPRAEAVARRLGLPPGVVASLRQAGELVEVAPGIDYPRDVLEVLLDRLDAVARDGSITTSEVAAALGTSRRYADALRAHAARRDRRPVR